MRLPAFLVRTVTIPHTGHKIDGLVIPGSAEISICITEERTNNKTIIYNEIEIDLLPKVIRYNINLIKKELLEEVKELEKELLAC